MTTTLSKPVRRKVTTAHGSPLIVTMTETGIEFREPRRRRAVALPYGVAWMAATKLAVAQDRVRKPRAKRGKL